MKKGNIKEGVNEKGKEKEGREQRKDRERVSWGDSLTRK